MNESISCGSCGREISPYAKACLYCGHSRGLQCAKCKKYSGENAAECSFCGARLRREAGVSADMRNGARLPAAGFGPVTSSVHRQHSRASPALVMGVIVCLLAIGGFVYLWCASAPKRHRAEAYAQVLLLWGEGDWQAMKGEFRKAVRSYKEALSDIERMSLEMPGVEKAVRKALLEAEIGLGFQDSPSPTAVSVALDKTEKAQGSSPTRGLSLQVIRVGPGMYAGKLCIDIWLRVENIGAGVIEVVPEKLIAMTKDGKRYPVARPTEPYHLHRKKLRPGESTSGVVVLRVPGDEDDVREQLSTMIYDNATHVPIPKE